VGYFHLNVLFSKKGLERRIMIEEREWRGRWFRATLRNYPLSLILPRKSGFYREILPGERTLGRFILPPFQRPSVWTVEQKIKLIESIIDEFPIPPYVVNRDLDGDYAYDHLLIDGQQRITAILDFMEDKFPVRGKCYSDVSAIDRTWFEDRPFSCLETNFKDIKILKEIYDRLAYGGTPHEPKNVQNQEDRCQTLEPG
jgi:uncharacterized protein with ParB-like and HNH nuclease domain